MTETTGSRLQEVGRKNNMAFGQDPTVADRNSPEETLPITKVVIRRFPRTTDPKKKGGEHPVKDQIRHSLGGDGPTVQPRYRMGPGSFVRCEIDGGNSETFLHNNWETSKAGTTGDGSIGASN